MRGALALVVEGVTGIVVAASVVLLLIEVDANTKAVRYQIESDRINRIRSAADSDYIPKIVAKIKEIDADAVEPATSALMTHYKLSMEDADRLSRHLGSIWEGLQADYKFGIRDVQYVRELLSYPDEVIFWEASQDRFVSCFSEWVNIIRSGETPPPAPPQNWLAEIHDLVFGENEEASNNCHNA